MLKPKPLDVLFKSRYIIDPSGCWLWTGNIGLNGYGRLTFNKKQITSHRISYFLQYGIWPDPNNEIDHLCRNRRCVNPLHLELVTRQENQHRGFSPSGINFRKTHCNKGHEFTKDNIIWHGRFKHKRRCRICYNKWNSSRYWRQKNALVV